MRRNLLSALLVFTSSLLFAQQLSKKQPLIAVLTSLQQQYSITFTYADKTIEAISVEDLDVLKSLEEILDQIQLQTNLAFQQISDNNYAVFRNYFFDITTTQYLDEVLVNNYIAKGITLKPNGIVNIKPRSFGILPGLIEPDVFQTIQSLPGVYSIDERVSNLNIRGGTNDQNLLLWDGIKMYQSGHFFGLVTAFSPYLLDKIKLSKNGTSAMYGDGVSGVIDMQTSASLKQNISGGLGLNLISGDGFLKIPIGNRNEFQFSVRRSITDLITTPTYDQYFKRIFEDTDVTNESNNTLSQNQEFYFYDSAFKWLSKLSNKDQLSISGIAIYNQLNYDETSSINDVDESLTSSLRQLNLGASITYERQWNERLKSAIQGYISHYNLDATNFNIDFNQRLIQENQIYDGGLKAHLNYSFAKNLNLFSGYQFTEVGISNLEDVNNPEFRRFVKEVVRTHAGFAEVTYLSGSKNTQIRIGGRANYFEKFDEFLIEPRFSFSQKFAQNFRFEVLGEIKSQTTTQIIDLQNDFLGVEKRRWILANNADIPITKSKQVSAGLHYKKNYFLVSAEAYLKQVDGITTRSQGFQNQFQFVNALGSFEVKGIDVLINQKFEKGSIWASYSFADNQYTFETLNNSISFPNNVDIRHQATLAGTYTFKEIEFALGINWRTGRPITLPNEINPVFEGELNYQSPNSSNLDDYLRIDLSANYKFDLSKKIKATAAISLWNVLDTENVVNAYFLLDDNDNISRVENLSLGLTPNASLRINF